MNDYAHNYAILILANVLWDLGRSTELNEAIRKQLYDAMLQKINELKQEHDNSRQTGNQSVPPQPVNILHVKYKGLTEWIKTEYEKILSQIIPTQVSL